MIINNRNDNKNDSSNNTDNKNGTIIIMTNMFLGGGLLDFLSRGEKKMNKINTNKYY